MPSLSEETAYHFNFTGCDLQRWYAVREALIGCDPSDRLRTLVERAITAACAEHRAAERRLFDVFDLITTNLLETGLELLGPEQYRCRLCERAEYHEKIAARIEDRPTHAEMHWRLAEQLREAAVAVKIPPPAAPPSRLRRARL